MIQYQTETFIISLYDYDYINIFNFILVHGSPTVWVWLSLEQLMIIFILVN